MPLAPYCAQCGSKFNDSRPEDRTRSCATCSVQVWANPVPVAIVLLPVRHEKGLGLLVVKRGIEPGKGKWALVGGFLEEHESWAEGGARELFEETGARVDAATLTPFWYTSSAPRPNRVLLFSTAPAIDATALDAFTPDHETLERGLVFSAEASTEGHAFAFPLHVEAVRRFFDAQPSKNDPETPIVSGI